MYWPCEQYTSPGSSSAATENSLFSNVRRRLFCRLIPLDLKILQDRPPAQQSSWMTSLSTLLQPITNGILRSSVTASTIFNQSAFTSAVCRTVRMGLHQEHEQPACSR
ncbi:hypothetical protein ACOMHN_031600 [Nucella lapillus]